MSQNEPSLALPPARCGSQIKTPLQPVQPEELAGEPIAPPPAPRSVKLKEEPAQVPGFKLPTKDEEWQEPDFSETPSDDGLDLKPVKYDELLNKVFRRKDLPESKKRYMPLNGYWHIIFREDDKGNQVTSKIWVLEVMVFIYTGAQNPDGSPAKKPLATIREGDLGNSLVRPGGFKIPAETFQKKYQLDQ